MNANEQPALELLATKTMERNAKLNEREITLQILNHSQSSPRLPHK